MNTRCWSSIGFVWWVGCASSAVTTRAGEPPLARPSTPTVETAREFHIPATDAPTALTVFARQADTQVLFDYVALRERPTRAVDGVLTPTDALEALLRGSGLVAEAVNARTLAITPDRFGHAMP